MNTRVLVSLLILFCAAWPSGVHSQRSQTRAVFDLAVQKSPVFRAGQTRLEATSASVTYTDEFFSGKVKALKVEFFAKGGDASLVLFLDEQLRIGQANLTYVVPGITVARTVADRPEDITNYFSDYRFDRTRLRLKSKGSYK